MSFFTHMDTDEDIHTKQEQPPWTTFTVSNGQKSFFEVSNDTVGEEEPFALDKQEPAPKRKFFSLFPSPKRVTPRDNSSNSSTEMPPPPPKLPVIKENKVHQLPQIEPTQPEPQKLDNNQTVMHYQGSNMDGPKPIETEFITPSDMVVGTVTRTESWQEVTCLRTTETDDIQFRIKDKKKFTGSSLKRKLFWESKEKRIKDGLKTIRDIKNSVVQMEKSDVESIVSLEDLKSQLLKENIASLDNEIDSLQSNYRDAVTRIERLRTCLEKVHPQRSDMVESNV